MILVRFMLMLISISSKQLNYYIFIKLLLTFWFAERDRNKNDYFKRRHFVYSNILRFLSWSNLTVEPFIDSSLKLLMVTYRDCLYVLLFDQQSEY